MIKIIIFYVIIMLCFEHGFCLPISHTGLATRSNVDALLGIAVSPCIGCEEGTKKALPRIQRVRTVEDYTVPQGAKRGILDKIGHAAEKSAKKNWFNVLNGVRMATNLGRVHRKNSTPQVANKSKGGIGGGGGIDEGGMAKGFKSSKGSSS